MILPPAAGLFCGSHLHSNCSRARECPFCNRCTGFSMRMAKCLRCYPRRENRCICGPHHQKFARMLQRSLKRAAFSPQDQAVSPVGFDSAVRHYQQMEEWKKTQHGPDFGEYARRAQEEFD